MTMIFVPKKARALYHNYESIILRLKFELIKCKHRVYAILDKWISQKYVFFSTT